MSRYAFGSFRLLAIERQLLAGDEPVRLGARAFDVLLALVERRDRTVSKSELLDAAWPNVVVEENNLQVQINALRKVLGHDAIATVPGVGYRLSVPVEPLDDASPTPDLPFTRGSRASETAAARTNLPTVLLALYGRDADVTAIGDLLSRHSVVTVVGAGGIGKTRVAQAVGRASLQAYGDGVGWVDLASTSHPALVPAVVARVLGLQLTTDRDVTEAVISVIRAQRRLLLLDNCEHLLDAVGEFVDALHREAPEVRVLATSQEPLKCADEQVYRLGNLAIPAAGADLAHTVAAGAVQLFTARARAAAGHFEVTDDNKHLVGEVCRRLDGIPLAIELAATRVGMLGLDQLQRLLDERFNVLTGGSRLVLRRHQTLRAAMEWSFTLLDESERTVLRRLAVFAGTFSLDHAQRVVTDEGIDRWAALDHLAALVDKSLVEVDGTASPRYRLLETTRVFAMEKLSEAGETDRWLRRHAEALLAHLEIVDEAARQWQGNEDIARFAADLDDLRAALDWTAGRGGDPVLAVRLAAVSSRVWQGSGMLFEGRSRLLALRDRVTGALPLPVRASYWLCLARLGLFTAQRESFEAADHASAAFAELGENHLRYDALCMRAAIGARRGELAVAREMLVEAAGLEDSNWPLRKRGLWQWANLMLRAAAGDYESGRAFALVQARMYEQDGLPLYAALAQGNAASMDIALGHLHEAETRLRDSIRTVEAAGFSEALIGYCFGNLMAVLIEQRRSAEAIEAGRRARVGLNVGGEDLWLLEPLALNALFNDRHAAAARIVGYVDREYGKSGEVRGPFQAKRRQQIDAQLVARFGTRDYEALRSDGARLNADQVFALAFGDVRQESAAEPVAN